MRIANLLKYTLGLIIIIPSTIFLILFTPIFMMCSLYDGGNINEGTTCVSDLLKELWRPVDEGD